MPRPIKDRTGDRYGRLTVLELSEVRFDRNGVKEPHWWVRCDCGAIFSVLGKSLQNGNTKSCGCYGLERNRASKTKHGESRGYTYTSWRAAKERCTNPKSRRYDIYGGRGITMCERWSSDYRNFLADLGERPKGMTLDRINPDGDYEPGNCRWATAFEQARNLKHTILVPWEGASVSLSHYAKLVGVNPSTLSWRVRVGGMDPVEAAAHIKSGRPFKRPQSRIGAAGRASPQN